MADKDKADAGQAEVQKRADAEEEQGFRGRKVDPYPNSAHSLQSGPDAPPVSKQLRDEQQPKEG